MELMNTKLDGAEVAGGGKGRDDKRRGIVKGIVILGGGCTMGSQGYFGEDAEERRRKKLSGKRFLFFWAKRS